MAESNPEISEEGEDEEVAAGVESKTSFVIAFINSIALLGALGFLAYTRLIYKHPVITDAAEKTRILAIKVAPSTPTEGMGEVPFGPLTINILSSPDNTIPTGSSSPVSQGRMHYLATAFTLEIRDKAEIELVQSLKPFILDKLIQLVGKKNFHELATVQGRYILHSQLIDMANQTIAARANNPPNDRLVTNLYFTVFLVQ